MSIKSAADIRGSTKILELIHALPDGRAVNLLSQLGWQCAYCAVSASEPLSLAAKRHGVRPHPVIACFRALYRGELNDELVRRAKEKCPSKKDRWANHVL